MIQKYCSEPVDIVDILLHYWIFTLIFMIYFGAVRFSVLFLHNSHRNRLFLDAIQQLLTDPDSDPNIFSV